MGLAEQQHVLVRLYTDATFRERFLADPHRASAELGLAAEDAQRLIQVSAPQVRFFARSLYRKRLGEVRKLLPATAQAIGPHFEGLFNQFAESAIPGGPKKHRQDALAFARFLGQRVGRDGDGLFPDWLVDVIRYEAAWLQATDASSHIMIRWFRYPVGGILRALEEGREPVSDGRHAALAGWLRPHGRARLRHTVWLLPRLDALHLSLRLRWSRWISST